MGLILCGAILVAFYVLKIFFPHFIIKVAEIPRLVKFGNWVQSNKWYLHIFNFITGYIHGYILFCACIRSKVLNWKENLILFLELTLLNIILEFYPIQYSPLSCAFMAITPFIMCVFSHKLSKETFISTLVCFSLELAFEFFSIAVRDLISITPCVNVMIVLILMIDVFIWRIILYLFFNYKNTKKGE